MRVGPRQIAALVILVLVVVFILQNDQDVDLEFVNLDATVPLWLALLGMFALGTVLGTLLSTRRRR